MNAVPDYAHLSTLAFRRDGPVLHVTFNRPETLNAFDDAMHQDFERFLLDVACDREAAVVVLTGAGKAFSAGGNIEHMQAIIDRPALMYDAMVMARRLIPLFLDVPQVVIAKVNGAAMGLGCTIALFSDLVYAADHARIADPHVKVGYVAGDGGAIIWPRLVGYNRAKEFLLTGDALTGTEAAAIGLVNHAVPAAELDTVVDAMAHRIASGARRAIQWTKATVNIGLKQAVAQAMDAGMAYEALSNHTHDHAEAVAAFRAKRDPGFKGD